MATPKTKSVPNIFDDDDCERAYAVQVLCVREFTVTETDELQAQRAAWAAMDQDDRDTAIAMFVCEAMDTEHELPNGGALNENAVEGWAFAKAKFESLSREWVED